MVAGQPVSRLDALAAMNADFYNLTTGVPSGRLRIDGSQMVGGDPLEPSLGLGSDRAAIGKRLSGWPDIVSGQAAAGAGRPGGGRPGRRRGHLVSVNARVPRVAVALRGRQLWLVGVGRPGLTMREFQRLLVAMGAGQALGFDSGPSADIAVAGRPLLGQPEQSVPVAIAIVPLADVSLPARQHPGFLPESSASPPRGAGLSRRREIVAEEAPQTSGTSKLFVRQSSGLVRDVSVTNALFFNVAAFVGVGLTLYPAFYSLGFVPVWTFGPLLRVRLGRHRHRPLLHPARPDLRVADLGHAALRRRLRLHDPHRRARSWAGSSRGRS